MVPVGFKYFSSLLFDGEIGIGGKNLQGIVPQKDGTIWTTDKDGMNYGFVKYYEIIAVMGKS